MTTDSIIEYKTEYVVVTDLRGRGNETRFQAHEKGMADLTVATLIAGTGDALERMEYVHNPEGVFGGSITWYVDDQVPATYLDEILDEYEGNVHGGQGLDDLSIDRAHRYLLIEKNRTTGYWLTTGDDVDQLATDSVNQEYASDWEIHEIHDLQEGRELDTLAILVHVSTT